MGEEPCGPGDEFGDWLDALDDGQGYYLACPAGHASLPPRAACPACGASDIQREALPRRGEVVAHTRVHVGTPAFDDETPYVTAIAAFGPVRLTGLVRDATDGVEIGRAVTAAAGRDEAARTVVFRPIETE